MNSKTVLLALALGVAGTAHAERPFDNADADKDGRVSKAEFEAATRTRMEGAYKAWDTNGDGTVTLEEFSAHAMKRADQIFQRFDRNKDGFLDKGEAKRARDAFKDKTEEPEKKSEGKQER